MAKNNLKKVTRTVAKDEKITLKDVERELKYQNKSKKTKPIPKKYLKVALENPTLGLLSD